MGTTSVDQQVDRAPEIDLERIKKSVDEAIALDLSKSTREAIERSAGRVRRALGMLLQEELRADEDPTVRGLFRQAYELLDRKSHPRPDTPTFARFSHMREMATVARRLLWVWEERQGHGIP